MSHSITPPSPLKSQQSDGDRGKPDELILAFRKLDRNPAVDEVLSKDDLLDAMTLDELVSGLTEKELLACSL